jgi:hypothetical protein
MLELVLVEPLSHLRQLLDHTAIMEFQRLTFPLEQLPAESKVVHEAYERVFGEGVAPIEVLVRAKREMMDRGIKEIGETETSRDWVAVCDLEVNPTVEGDERLGIPPVSDSDGGKNHEEDGSGLKLKNNEVSEVSADLEDLKISQETSEEYASIGVKKGVEQDHDGSNSDADTVRLWKLGTSTMATTQVTTFEACYSNRSLLSDTTRRHHVPFHPPYHVLKASPAPDLDREVVLVCSSVPNHLPL